MNLPGPPRPLEPLMKFLVTGGAGFLGSHLCDALLAKGHEVLALDDLSTGTQANLEQAGGSPGFEFLEASALDSRVVSEAVAACDRVFHFAAAVGVRLIVDRPVHTILTNVDATRVVLEACAEKGTPFFLASTSEVYGKSDAAPFREDGDLTLGSTERSRWAYACSKALDEWLAFAFAAERGVPIRIARFFNVVGPRQTGRYGMVLPSLVRQALRGTPLTVYGTGEQTRCFASVSDVVRAVIALDESAAAEGQVVNVGSDEEVTITALAERVRSRTQSGSVMIRVPYEEAYAEGFEDMMRRVPSLEKLEALVGFRPRTGLDAIIDEVVESLR